ncbi:hypothetical protein VZC37_24365 [Gordonia sp. LSe1-13]|uniref:Uncharacterized protein n=2 Tax=Gordonia TaxID=2053 RepID=A0ABU7MLQ0_9ACTN|nr:hypothetical protein [Gordonia sp. LSe1-13]MEE4024685.1 hypothetical protein [Gordonia sp. PKS22-38]
MSESENPAPTAASQSGTTTVPPRPGPHMMPGAIGTSGTQDADEPGSDVDPASVTRSVSDLLEQVDDIRQTTGGSFDLAALGRQTELLERAHEVLTAALDDVDPR